MQEINLPDHAGDAYTQASLALRNLAPGMRLALHGYHRKHHGSLCHQARAGIWAFVKHHEDRLRVVSWDEPVTVERHAEPRGWSIGEGMGHLFGGVLIINLKEARDRRTRMEALLSEHGINAEFLMVDRIDWENVSPEEYRRVEAYWNDDLKINPTFLGGLVGARRSHRLAVETAKERGWASVMVMEDDTEFAPQSAEVLERVHEELPDDWQLLTMSYACPRTEWHSPSLLRHFGGWLAGAYAVHHSAYDSIIQWWKICGTEVDNFSLLYQETALKGYAVFPRIAWENGLPSTIGKPEGWEG